MSGQPSDYATYFAIDPLDGRVFQLENAPKDVASYSIYVKASQVRERRFRGQAAAAAVVVVVVVVVVEGLSVRMSVRPSVR